MAATTPKYLLPAMEGTPVSEPAFYRSLFIVDTPQKGTGGRGTESPGTGAARHRDPLLPRQPSQSGRDYTGRVRSQSTPFDETKIGSGNTARIGSWNSRRTQAGMGAKWPSPWGGNLLQSTSAWRLAKSPGSP